MPGMSMVETNTTDFFEDDVLAAIARFKRMHLPQRPIAFYGSSSFRMWPSMAADLHSLDVVNLGFGGGTFASGLRYFDQLLMPVNPARVVLYFGENDISNDGLTAEFTLSGLKQLTSEIADKLPGVPVFVLSAKQSPTKWLCAKQVFAFNDLAKAYCESTAGLTYVDVGSCLLGENGLPMMRYFMPDLIHLNPAGYARWASVLRGVSGLLM
jgi:lysophospholipase L1-like esterase